jgi:hypothetical protein
MLTGRHRSQRDLGMGEQKLDEHFSGITGCTNDTDFHVAED